MTASHPLDHVAWLALTGRQQHLAIRRGSALRFDPAFSFFAAIPDRSAASLADLGAMIRDYGDLAFLTPNPPTDAPGVAVTWQHKGVQMFAERLTGTSTNRHEIVLLASADAREMLELATLTEPGPFFSRTHELGEFLGIKDGGRLVAMAGERMKPEGFTEVSAVCTHPDWRGRGLAAELTRAVAERILERGETPFLHAFASNTAAIRLYQDLGFVPRCEVLMTRLTRAAG